MDLTITSFLIAVIGIILQLVDAFPDHRETRKVIVFLTLGVFVGVAISAALGTTYKITGNVDRQFILLYVIAGAAVVFALLAVFVSNQPRQQVALTAAGTATLMFFLVGLAVAFGSAKDGSSYYTADEVLLLPNSAERNGQYETAIERLKELEQRLDGPDAKAAIVKRIGKLQAAQISRAAQ